MLGDAADKGIGKAVAGTRFQPQRSVSSDCAGPPSRQDADPGGSERLPVTDGSYRHGSAAPDGRREPVTGVRAAMLHDQHRGREVGRQTDQHLAERGGAAQGGGDHQHVERRASRLIVYAG
jgi:hypothetical protein